jgi:thiosulfate dehydrogenase (quinone) large subunit
MREVNDLGTTHPGRQPSTGRNTVAASAPSRLWMERQAPEAKGLALLPLRAFLGITYCFAGLQKLANPSFFHASSPTPLLITRTWKPRSRAPVFHLTTRLGPLMTAPEQMSPGGRNSRAISFACVGLAGMVVAVGAAVIGRLMH